MAERAVSFAVNKLGDLLVQEAVFLVGVGDGLRWLHRELSRMQCFLKDADAKRRRGDERVKQWVKEIRDAAYEAEDIADAYIYAASRKGFRATMKRIFFITRHKTGKRIETLKAKIVEISASRISYGISNLPESEHLVQRPVLPYVDDDEIIILQTEKQSIIERLLDARNLELSALSLVGPGGLGKTTLAQNIYKSPKINSHFDDRIWITISSQYKFSEVLKKILKFFSINPKDMDENEMLGKVRDLLITRIYLIVLDDVWSRDFWQEIQTALPNANNGSRVIITTRDLNIAKESCDTRDIYELRFLNDEEGRQLLLKKAFPRGQSCPEELLDLVPRLIQKCAGLPLALVVLGRLLLVTEKSHDAWSTILKTMSWYSTDGDKCMQVLRTSYEDLPYYLKSCFLYVAAFPEDHEIKASTLLKLWMAEGFVPTQEGKSLEDTAEYCLQELIHRSLIQVVERKHNGSVKTCHVHDLLHGLAINEAKADRFMFIHKSTDYDETISFNSIRRLSVDYPMKSEWAESISPNLRSLILIITYDEFVPRAILGAPFRLLRVLKLARSSKTDRLKLPDEITTLIHLRYLGLSMCGISFLPSSIGNMKNLQTLDLKFNLVENVPSQLWTIKTLRYVHLQSRKNIPPPATTCAEIKNLRVITGLTCTTSSDLRNVSNITNLRKLGLTFRGGCIMDIDLCWSFLSKLEQLISLKLESFGVDGFIFTNSSSMEHPSLQSLLIWGRWTPRLIPTNLEFPKHISKLVFISTGWKEDPMPVLEKLRSLRVLRLQKNSYMGEEMVCSANVINGGGGFPELRELVFAMLPNLIRWQVMVGSMPKLTLLRIYNCDELVQLPDLGHITTLQILIQ